MVEQGSAKSTVRLIEVALCWNGNVMNVEHFSQPGPIMIGPDVPHSLQCFHTSIPKNGYALIANTSHGALVNLAPWMKLKVNGAQRVANTHSLGDNEKVSVGVGDFSFDIQYVNRGQIYPVGIFSEVDLDFAKILAMVLILQTGLLVAILITRKFGTEEEEFFAKADEYRELVLKPEEQKKKVETSLLAKKEGQHKDDEGQLGKKELPKHDKAPSAPGAPNVQVDKREQDRKIAFNALKNLGLRDEQAAVSNKFGPGGLGTGASKALGGLHGVGMGNAGGSESLGTRGAGAGGGGNSLGIGGLGSGVGKGIGGLELDGGEKSRIRILPGKITYEGGLTQAEIQRVINRFMSQIKFCYGRELQKAPDLEGKLVANWVIAADGSIQTSRMSQNTMGNAVVEACVLRVIGRMKFPQPRGGGVVSVTYPFVFSAAGA